MKWIKHLCVMTVGLCCACSNNQGNAVHLDSEEDSAQTVTKSDSMAVVSEMGDSTAEQIEQDAVESILNGRSLNDIRFANFKSSKDWLDNEYIRTLRSYLDDYVAGKVEDPELEPYKDGVKSQFVIYDTEPFLGGGLFIRVIFLDMPDKLFAAWVYSSVDIKTETVEDYDCRSIRLVAEESGLTKEDLIQGVKETPGLKFW